MMELKSKDITFMRIAGSDQMPYELLLLADPSKDLVDQYLKQSDVFIARRNKQTLGVIVLFPSSAETAEIKNIAVNPALQRQGIGSYLIENVIKAATLKKLKSLYVGTANSSTGQLYLYQKFGFEITGIRKNFFTDNYPEPIYENGIQAKHMLILTRPL